ncbi:MAG: pilus assembly protein PilY, partial [Pseudomonas sp. PGPPP3]
MELQAPLIKVSKVKWNGDTKDVLIFTGGYDANQDDDTPNTPSNDTYGNALYIADANTGERLWMAGPAPVSGETAAANLQLSTMTNSMPADPALVDISGDGLIDTIFTADTRGQIFRFDINQANTTATNFATGGRVANFGGTTAQNNRRFYNQPDVALIKERGGKTYFTVSIGSGYRGHPLNEETIDRFYVVRDTNVYTKPTTYTTVTESNLVDVSSVSLSGTAAAAIQTQIDTKRGQIDSLTLAESSARTALASYQASVGYTSKQEQLLQTNNDINIKQAAIETILKVDPYIAEHATETDARTQLNNLIVGALSGLEQLNALTSYATNSDTTAFITTQLSNADIADWGLLQANLQYVNAHTDNTKYQAVVDAE